MSIRVKDRWEPGRIFPMAEAVFTHLRDGGERRGVAEQSTKTAENTALAFGFLIEMLRENGYLSQFEAAFFMGSAEEIP